MSPIELLKLVAGSCMEDPRTGDFVVPREIMGKVNKYLRLNEICDKEDECVSISVGGLVSNLMNYDSCHDGIVDAAAAKLLELESELHKLKGLSDES